MKNKIFILIVIVSSLFLIDNVKAETFIYDYNSSNLDLLKDNLNIVDEIKKISNEFNTNNYTYYVSYYKSYGSFYLSVGVSTYSCSSSFYTFSYSFSNDRDLYNGEVSYLNGNDNLCEDFVQIGSKLFTDYVSLNLSNLTDENLQTFLTSVKSFFVNGPNKYGSMQSQTYQYKSNLDVFSNNNFSVPVYSNSKLKYVKRYNDTKTNEKLIQIDDITYNYDDIIHTYYDYFGLDNPKKYEFDDIIHDDNIANTYFDLNMNELINNNFNIDINYSYGNYTSNILAPYLEIKYNNDTNSFISLNNNDIPIVNVYMGNYSLCLDNIENITSVRIVFPMNNTKDIDYKIQLKSNVSFDISYEYDEEFNQNLTTVDLTGKYALLLIPKVKNENGFLDDFYLYGDFEIRHISNIDDIENSNFSYGKKNGDYYRFLSDFRYETGAIEFVNNNYNTNEISSITFSKDKFNYYIIENKNSVINITNPNTDIKSNFDSTIMDNNFNEKATNQSYSDLYGTLGQFVNENENAQTLLKMSLKKFIDTCPREIQRFILIFILFSVAVCSFAVAGWR